MRLLVDTHAFLWFIGGDRRLSEAVRSALESGKHENWVSVASVWEIAIKAALGKIQFSEPMEEVLRRELAGFSLLAISLDHALQTYQLPLHHRDPFDRLLVAQCQVENLAVVSIDDCFDAYGIQRYWLEIPAE